MSSRASTRAVLPRGLERLFTALLLVTLVAGSAAALADPVEATAETASAPTFTDIDVVHRPAIEALAAEGVLLGCETDRFCPSAQVTRAQLASLLTRTLDLPDARLPGFRDVGAGDTHAAAIASVVDAGIFRGVDSRHFAPGADTSRAQMATVLVRAFELPTAEGGARFADTNGSVHADAIDALAAAGVTEGCAPDRYCPSASVTRGQVATFLAVAAGLIEAGDARAPLPAPADQPSDSKEALLARREGFGRNAGEGSLQWPTVTVTSLADSGSGTLREALSSGNRWIRFSPGLTGTIDVRTRLAVPSNVVIDGRGADITLAAGSSTNILTMTRVNNIIVTNLKLSGGYDAIQIYQRTTNVWLDHLTTNAAADEVIGITGDTERPDLITVSWSRFNNAGKVMLLSGSETDINHSADRVTLHHNLYHRSFDRHPLVRFSRVHAYNNWLYQWGRQGTGQGIRVGNAGQFRSEANIYDDIHGRPALVPEDLGTYGNIISVGDLVTGNPEIQQRNPNQVFDPADHYPYEVDTPGDALRTTLTNNAGWQPTS